MKSKTDIKITDNKLDEIVQDYIDSNWEEIIQDIDSLVRIPSYVAEDGSDHTKQYPTGKTPALAMKQALKIARRLGFRTKNHNNHIGIADIKGSSNTMVGFIGHCDVVEDGFGWKFDPFKVTRHNGYVIGRGVVDDKGPNVLAMHAISLLEKTYKDYGITMPYTIRYMLGTDEENGMTDIDAYLKNYQQPKIVISPDADFPICYGEAGLTRVKVISPKINKGQIKFIWGGTSDNAVPGYSRAIVKMPKDQPLFKQGSRLAHAIMVEPIKNDQYQITAKGRSAHASTPYEGLDAIAILSQFLLEKNIGNKEEKEFLEFIAKIAGRPSGDGIGLDCEDKDFGPLTIVTSMLRCEKGHFTQIFDVRYPTSITAKKIGDIIEKAAPKGCSTKRGKEEKPFLVDPKSPVITTLAKSYEDATGESAKIFTMGGSTYARHFNIATSFGPEMPWTPKPAWVGNIHAADEGMSEDDMKRALKIYVYTIKNLMNLDLDSKDFGKSSK